jgi:hypothetical protein
MNRSELPLAAAYKNDRTLRRSSTPAPAPTEGVSGTFIRIRNHADHPAGVMLDLWCFRTRWTDSFRGEGLKVIPKQP